LPTKFSKRSNCFAGSKAMPNRRAIGLNSTGNGLSTNSSNAVTLVP
jgi:hypothetical protein